ncbi:MAG TPA: YciI family protein [Streptosporangiaceae bacterium]|nr:YciI family protein [Streptosporangiaceae bacterium]
MKQYFLGVCLVDDGSAVPSPEEMQPTYDQVAAFNDEVQAAGRWVFAGGLYPPGTSTVVKSDGIDTLIVDGPFAEGKEYIGGFWVIKAEDLDDALSWAQRGSRACGAPVEVRPFQEDSEG